MTLLKLTYGLKDGRFRHVTSVENGLACNCHCHECGEALIARNQGTIRAYHFAHHKGAECPGSVETALHKMAIQLLCEQKRVLTPEFQYCPQKKDRHGNIHYGEEIRIPPTMVQFDVMEPEYSREGFRVDATGFKDTNMLHIEIRVSHEVDDDKRKKVEKTGESMMEIDLSKSHPDTLMDEEGFITLVLDDKASRNWIHNRKIEERVKLAKENLDRKIAKINAALQEKDELEQNQANQKRIKNEQFHAREKKERERYKEELEKLDACLTISWIENRENELENALINEFQKHGKDINPASFPPYLNVDIPKDWIFNVHRSVWQNAILDRFIQGSDIGGTIHAGEVTNWVVDNFGVLDFVYTLDSLRRKWKAEGKRRNKYYGEYGCWFLSERENRSIPSPFGVVITYLKYLEKNGFIASNVKKDIRFVVKINSLEDYHNALIERQKQELERERRRLRSTEKYRNLQEERVKQHENSILQLKNAINVRRREIIASEKRVYELFDGDGRKCQSCFFVSHKSEGEVCPFCNGTEFQDIHITDEHLSVADNKYKSFPHVRESVCYLSDVDTSLLEPWLDNS